jgi:hypothetical protein
LGGELNGKRIKIRGTIFKVYDLLFFALLIVATILVAAISGAANLNIDGGVIAIVVICIEMAYIFGVINKRNKKTA